jgi:hypothetical protein
MPARNHRPATIVPPGADTLVGFAQFPGLPPFVVPAGFGARDQWSGQAMRGPGTAKSMTASDLATELSLPFVTIRLDALTSKYRGETTAKLRVSPASTVPSQPLQRQCIAMLQPDFECY